jgi:hypothetical protein
MASAALDDSVAELVAAGCPKELAELVVRIEAEREARFKASPACIWGHLRALKKNVRRMSVRSRTFRRDHSRYLLPGCV